MHADAVSALPQGSFAQTGEWMPPVGQKRRIEEGGKLTEHMLVLNRITAMWAAARGRIVRRGHARRVRPIYL